MGRAHLWLVGSNKPHAPMQASRSCAVTKARNDVVPSPADRWKFWSDDAQGGMGEKGRVQSWGGAGLALR